MTTLVSIVLKITQRIKSAVDLIINCKKVYSQPSQPEADGRCVGVEMLIFPLLPKAGCCRLDITTIPTGIPIYFLLIYSCMCINILNEKCIHIIFIKKHFLKIRDKGLISTFLNQCRQPNFNTL